MRGDVPDRGVRPVVDGDGQVPEDSRGAGDPVPLGAVGPPLPVEVAEWDLGGVGEQARVDLASGHLQAGDGHGAVMGERVGGLEAEDGLAGAGTGPDHVQGARPPPADAVVDAGPRGGGEPSGLLDAVDGGVDALADELADGLRVGCRLVEGGADQGVGLDGVGDGVEDLPGADQGGGQGPVAGRLDEPVRVGGGQDGGG